MKFVVWLLTRQRRWTAAAVVAVSAAAVFGLTRLGFDDRYQDAFRSEDASFRDFQRLADAFGAGESDCVVLLESADMTARPAVEAVRRMHSAVVDLPQVESTVSLLTVRRGKRVGRYFLPLFPGGGAPDDDFAKARDAALVHPMVVGKLLSPDRRTSILLVRLKPELQTIDALEPALAAIREVVQKVSAGTDVTTHLTGIPAIRVETIRRLQHDHMLVTLAGAVFSTIFAWMLLRRPAAVLLMIGPAMVGVLWTLGALGLAGKNLNAVNIVLAPLVMVIGGADSIHVVFHYRHARSEGLSPIDAIARSLSELIGACGLTALTTSAGFLSLLVSDDRIIGEFGIFGGVGVTLTFVAVMTLLPLLCTTRLGQAFDEHEPVAGTNPAATTNPTATWPDRYLNFFAPHACWIAPVLLLATVLMSGKVWQLKADFHFLENLTEASESYAAMRRLEAELGGGPTLQVLVACPPERAVRSAETVAVLVDVHAAIAQGGTFRAPSSLLTLLESLPGAEGDPAAKFDELKFIPPDRLRSIVDDERRLALVTAYAPDSGAAMLREPLDALQSRLAEAETRHPGYDLAATGFSVLSTYRASSMISDLFDGLGLEVLVIFVVITLALRSVTLGLLSLPSNLFPLLLTIVVMQLAGLPLQYSTVLALNICLGIAVDDTVHFLSRYRHELAIDGDRLAALRRSFHVVAPVMVTSTVLMLTGFGAGLFCSIPTVRAFSLCACTALVFALASEAIVLPAILLCLARLAEWRSPPTQQLPSPLMGEGAEVKG